MSDDGFDVQVTSLTGGAEVWCGWGERIGRASGQLAGESSGGFADDVAAAARCFLDSWAQLNDDLSVSLNDLAQGVTSNADRYLTTDGIIAEWMNMGQQP